MNSGVFRTLEFDRILDVLRSFTSTALGSDLARALTPSYDPCAVRHLLQETSEACRLLSEGKLVPLSDTPDVRPGLEVLRIENQVLDIQGLMDLAVFSRVSHRARSSILSSRLDLELLPSLAAQIPDLDRLAASVERAIDFETRSVKDSASPELRSLRARAFKLKNRLRGILESYLRQKDSRKILQEPIITERNGRAVLPVRSECRGQMVGIVHGSSSSGATLFIEPLSTVELNNDIVAVEEEERHEVEKILFALTQEARLLQPELSRAADIVSRLDLIQAKALLSEAFRGSEPQVCEEKRLRLISASHPLLLGPIARRGGLPAPAREAVPISFEVGPDRTVLVLTGPNTGGKTVALKTAGLLCLMVQAGLHVPADARSVFPVLRKVFADIGDEQSIGSSLSTFSAHLRNIVEMERSLEEPALVLLDEVGTGTDPAEGGPLGTSLVEHFRRRGALVLASTHHSMLKTYATTTAGVGSASFMFDPETYEPTYELVEGSTGRSLAFEMALRLGLSEDIVQRARRLQTEKERKVEDMLARLESDAKTLAQDQARLAEQQRALDEAILRHREEEHKYALNRDEELKAFGEQLRAETSRARMKLREIVDQVETRLASEAQSRPQVVEVAKYGADRIRELEVELVPPEEPRPVHPPVKVCPGERVTITSLGLTGIVAEAIGDDVEVLVRDKRLRIPLANLESVAPGQAVSSPEPYVAHTSVPERKEVPSELNIIGCTVDEAISQADKFLDDAFLSERRTVRLIHGLGKGRLRHAIHEWLETHPHVTRHEAEPSGAVTVVELKV